MSQSEFTCIKDLGMDPFYLPGPCDLHQKNSGETQNEVSNTDKVSLEYTVMGQGQTMARETRALICNLGGRNTIF